VVADLGAASRPHDGPRSGGPTIKWTLVLTIEIIY
jgi:hypothetical protein